MELFFILGSSYFQPVPKIDEEITAAANEAISADVPLDQLRQEPYSLPQGFEWDTLNLDDPLVVSRICQFSL